MDGAGQRRGPLPLPLPERRRRPPEPTRSSTTSSSSPAARRCSPTTWSVGTTAGRPRAASRSAPAPRRRMGDRYYIVENRTYVGYDVSLEEGPYQFSYALHARPTRSSTSRSRTGCSSGWSTRPTRTTTPSSIRATASRSRWMPGPTPFGYEDGIGRPSNRRQPFDATFGLQATDDVTLHKEVLVGQRQEPDHRNRRRAGAVEPGHPDVHRRRRGRLLLRATTRCRRRSSPATAWTVTVTGQTTGGTMTIEVSNPD